MQEHVQVDSSKCKACRRCEVACIASHHGLDFKTAMKQKALYSPRCWAVKGDDFKTSVRCHGCNPAPCCNICPTGALSQNADGTFSIHLELCAGCMMCMQVCPYGVISPEEIGKQENPENLPATARTKTIAVRCDLCQDWRREKGVEYTACMEACMTQALSLVRADGTILDMPKPEKKAPAKAVSEEAPNNAAKEEEKKNPPEPVAKPAPKPEAQAEVSQEIKPAKEEAPVKAEVEAEVSQETKPAKEEAPEKAEALPEAEVADADKDDGQKNAAKADKKNKKSKKKK